MSKYIIKVIESRYFPEGNYQKEKEIYYQECNDDDVVKKIAVAVNNDTSVAKSSSRNTSIEELLERALVLVRGSYLTKEQEELVTALFCCRKLHHDD